MMPRNALIPFTALLVVLLLGTAPALCGAETLNRIVAVVNDEIITAYELDQRLATLPEAQRKDAAAPLLERMVEERLLQQRAKEIGVAVSEGEIDAAISDIQVQNRLTLEQLEEALKQQGQTLKSYRESLRSDILRYKLLGREVQAKADVTTQELRNYYEEHRKEYRLPPTVTLGVVNVAVPEKTSAAGRELLRGKAERAREQLQEQGDFAASLKRLAEDPDVAGSELGAFAEAELSTLFADAVRELTVGGVSEVLEVPGGYALLTVLARAEGSFRPFDEVRGEIEETVRARKTEELFDAWKKGLREEALVDIRL